MVSILKKPHRITSYNVCYTKLLRQPNYNMFDRWIEDGLLDVLENNGVGCIVFSPLAQGMLTNKYLGGIPADSRAAKPSIFLRPEHITETVLSKVTRLNEIAHRNNFV